LDFSSEGNLVPRLSSLFFPSHGARERERDGKERDPGNEVDLKVGGSMPSPCHRVVPLNKKLYPHLSLPHCLSTRRHTAGGNPAMD